MKFINCLSIVLLFEMCFSFIVYTSTDLLRIINKSVFKLAYLMNTIEVMKKKINR